MCGIVGAINLHAGQEPLEPAVVLRMLEAVRDRGPDAKGLWVDPQGNVALGNARLSTMDPRPVANQPLWDADGVAVITFNGEIYNQAELRRELEQQGCRFKTRSDTEVVLNAYTTYGTQMLERLEGQFAFVLYDLKTRRVLMARDPVGICPFYYALHEERLWFASEPRALLQVPDLPRRLNPAALYQFLVLQSTALGDTLYKGIRFLRAGNAMAFPLFGPLREWRYADFLFRRREDWQVPEGGWPAYFHVLLQDAVSRRMAGDKEVGVFLSGGLDSGAVLALMRVHDSRREIKSFTVGFQADDDDPPSGELVEARQASERFGTRHEEILVSPDAILDRVGRFELPAASILEALFDVMAAKTAARGVQVVLTGEGADETFFGYDHYFAAVGRLSPAHSALAQRYPLRGEQGDGHRIQMLPDAFLGGGVEVSLEAQRDRIFSERVKDALPVRSLVERRLEELRMLHPDPELDKQILYLDLCQKLPEYFLRRIERPLMGHGVEVRLPYLDLRLIQAHVQLPMALRIGEGEFKMLLKRAMADILPPEILGRPKTPFGMPATRSSYYAGSGRTFPYPMLRTLFATHFRQVREAILDGAWMREEVVNADYLEARLLKQRDVRSAWFDPFLWQVWNLAAWYERWVAGEPVGCAPNPF